MAHFSKQILTILISTVSICTVYSQEFAPIGANWKYTGWVDGPSYKAPTCEVSDCASIRIQLVSVDTFLFNGTPCSRIQLGETFDPDSSLPSFDVCYENKQYYFLEEDSLYLFMDFNLEIGDTLVHNTPRNMGFTRLWLNDFSYLHDSIQIIEGHSIITEREIVNISGEDLIQLQFEAIHNLAFDGAPYPILTKSIEKIGNIGSYFGYSNVISASGCGEGFKCYEDQSRLFHVLDCDSCFFPDHVTNTSELGRPDLWIYPSVTSDIVNISNVDIQEPLNISIVNLEGQVIKKLLLSDNIIDLSSLDSGLYIIKMEYSNFLYSFKVTKV